MIEPLILCAVVVSLAINVVTLRRLRRIARWRFKQRLHPRAPGGYLARALAAARSIGWYGYIAPEADDWALRIDRFAIGGSAEPEPDESKSFDFGLEG